MAREEYKRIGKYTANNPLRMYDKYAVETKLEPASGSGCKLHLWRAITQLRHSLAFVREAIRTIHGYLTLYPWPPPGIGWLASYLCFDARHSGSSD